MNCDARPICGDSHCEHDGATLVTVRRAAKSWPGTTEPRLMAGRPAGHAVAVHICPVHIESLEIRGYEVRL